MSSFLARTFCVIADQPETICAVLGTSHEIMNCSAVPVTLSSDETWDSLCWHPKTEQKLLQLFSSFSDTMQFTEKLRIQVRQEPDFVKRIFEKLINKRYFARTIRVLQLPSVDALIEACCSPHNSSTTTTPILLSNLRCLSLNKGSSAPQNEQLKTICKHCCPFLETLKIPCQALLTNEGVQFLSNLKNLKTLDLLGCMNITDDGLEHLSKMSSLQSLNLAGCDKITDDGLEHLSKLSSLQALDLSWCVNVTDSGLEHLAKLSSLHSLNLGRCTQVTIAGCRVFSESTKVIRW